MAAVSLMVTGCLGNDDEQAAPSPAPEVSSASASASEPSEAPSESEQPSEADTATAGHATLEDLDRMTIPEECMDLGGQRLEGGERKDESTRANARWVRDFEPIPVDGDGDGVDELLAVFYCDGGGVSWPDQIALVAAGGETLDSVPLTEAYGPGADKAGIQSWEPTPEDFSDDGASFVAHFANGPEDLGELPGIATAVDGEVHIMYAETEDPFRDAMVSLSGYGPLGLGLSGSSLVERGWAVEEVEAEVCMYLVPSAELEERGVYFAIPGGLARGGNLRELRMQQPGAATPSGIEVGSTVEELQEAYGDDLEQFQEPYPYIVEMDGRTMSFEIADGKVASIGVHDYGRDELLDTGGGC